jgi:hypothetical protein
MKRARGLFRLHAAAAAGGGFIRSADLSGDLGLFRADPRDPECIADR